MVWIVVVGPGPGFVWSRFGGWRYNRGVVGRRVRYWSVEGGWVEVLVGVRYAWVSAAGPPTHSPPRDEPPDAKRPRHR